MMNYTNKQIIKILSIQEFLETTNTLSKLYNEYGNNNFTLEKITERQRIYKLYCSMMYNLTEAIKKSAQIFSTSTYYDLFQKTINQKYVANDSKYYEKENYESNLYKILGQIRHQNNHFEKEENDDIVLFEIYVDFEVIDNLRKIINKMFYEIYYEIDKEKIKQIILSKKSIKYSLDKLSNEVNNIKLKFNELIEKNDTTFAKENKRAMELFEELFDSNNLCDLFLSNPNALDKLNSMFLEVQEMFNKAEIYIDNNGSEINKEAIKLLKEYCFNDEIVTTDEYDNRMKELIDKIKEMSLKS